MGVSNMTAYKHVISVSRHITAVSEGPVFIYAVLVGLYLQVTGQDNKIKTHGLMDSSVQETG